ncbi:hypothetical protein [Chamaesiphon sp. VAR_69_metabat_338]|nr:hypothetical protein [Chamaesiphon sp. VAR_69_metabat_338]
MKVAIFITQSSDWSIDEDEVDRVTRSNVTQVERGQIYKNEI